MQEIIKKILLFLLEKAPVISWVNGHKTLLSRASSIVALALWYLQNHFPAYSVVLDQVNFFYVFICTTLGLEIGLWHRDQKEVKGL